MNKINVLFIPSWYKSRISNEGSFFTEQIETLISHQNINASLISVKRFHLKDILNCKITPKLYKTFRLSNSFHSIQKETFVLPTSKKLRFLNPIIRYISDQLEIFQYLRLLKLNIKECGKPDLIHAHSFYPGSALKKISNKYNIPYIITEHWSGFNNPAQIQARFKRIQKAYSQTSHLICVSSDLQKKIEGTEKILPSNIQTSVIHNLLPNSFFKSTAKPSISRTNDQPFKFLAIGYFQRIKNFPSLVTEFSKLLELKPKLNVQLHFVGVGEEFHQTKSITKKLGLTQQVIFHGKQDRSQVLTLIQNSQCVVSVSNYETFGMTLIEAGAQGKPILAIASGGRRDIIENKINGIAIPSLDKTHSAMLEMINTYSFFNPSIIKNKTLEKFGPVKITTQLIKLYKHTIQKNTK